MTYETGFGDDITDYIDTAGHWLNYEIKRDFSNQNPPPRLIRFMPIEQYLSILTTGRLYIPRATEYDDPYDCAFPGSLSDAIREELLKSCLEPEFSLPSELDHFAFVQQCEDILAGRLSEEFSDEVPDRWFVSCWHAGETATDLMWRSYGGHKGGVAISCNGPALLQQIRDTIRISRNALTADDSQEHFDFMHAYVDYERPVFEVEPDEDSGPTVTVRHPAFHKNHFFRLDEEFRFAARLKTEDTTFYSAGAKLDLMTCEAEVSTSPLCPRWIAKSVEAVTRKFYPQISFKQLSLEE